LDAHRAANYPTRTDELRPSVLPDDWYALLPRAMSAKGDLYPCAEERELLCEALDDAVRAFTRLPHARRAELPAPD
jgi:hypothetical protein